MSLRRRSRELTLQILFQNEFQDGLEPEQLLNLFKGNFESEPDIIDYSKLLLSGCLKNLTKIDELIQTTSSHWNIKRMALVDRNILRIAVYEILHLKDDVPARVVINEAVEIAKRFGSNDSKSFINGILDNISKNS